MSTRCMIGYEGQGALIYRHSDGYPDGEHGVLATLIPFRDHFFKLRHDAGEYFLARLLAWQPDYDREGVTGYGIDTAFHGDLAYYYHVLCNGDIEVYSCYEAGIIPALPGAPDYRDILGFQFVKII